MENTKNTNVKIKQSQKEDKSKTKTSIEKNVSKGNSSKEKQNSINTTSITDTKENKSLDNDNNAKDSYSKITKDKAVQLVVKSVKQKSSNTKFTFDHETTRNNINYYVIHGFDNMQDHAATSGWYYVDKSSGKVYEWDLTNDKLNMIN